MASYLGRNVNLTLLVIIIAVVVALVGTTVFFQRSLTDRTSTLEDTSGSLQQCEVALANYQERYSEAEQRVNETAQDIRRYDQLYEQKVSELEDSQDELLKTKKQLEFQELQAEKFKTSYEDQLKENEQLQLSIESKDARIQELNDRINDLKDELAACQG